ncbi:hypothetical protein WJX74_009769 [Apatococcus lobatus]|uniref:non-specific serine/threonine protein kinase n=1 Tax=Apatococcus lobatus TaxID=904363 RepID=A0AAW1RIV0_9CHLO
MQPPEGFNEGSLSVDSERFERLEIVGRGSFGDVYRGWDRELAREVAIKVIDLEDVEDDIDDIYREVAVLARCDCPNITRYFASVLRPGSSELYIVMELMAVSVADLVGVNSLMESMVAWICKQVLQALLYLHSEQRIHRDLKAANILMSSQGDVKISDFGVSGQLTATLGHKRRTFVGTPYWMAPEVIESSEEGYTQLADVWSLGITAIEMATGKPPHADVHPMRVLFLIPKNPAPELEATFSPAFQEFVRSCLQKDPSARLSAEELMQLDFIANAQPPGDLLRSIQTAVPMRRVVRGLPSSPVLGQTMPRWEFDRGREGSASGGLGSQEEGGPAGRPFGDHQHQTLRSHEINNWTLRNGTLVDRDEAGSQDGGLLDAHDPLPDLPGGFDTGTVRATANPYRGSIREGSLDAGGSAVQDLQQEASRPYEAAYHSIGHLKQQQLDFGDGHRPESSPERPQVGAFDRGEATLHGHKLPPSSVKPEVTDSPLPSLGPLGDYLMACWRSRMAAQQPRHAKATSCFCQSRHAVKAPEACIQAKQPHRQITSPGGWARRRPALCTANILAVTPVLAWFLLPDAASAEGLIPMGVFQSWLTEIEAVGPWGPVIFVVSVAAGEMIPLLPTQPLAIAGGLLFGAVRGTLFVLLGTTAAAVMAFSFSRGIGKQLASKVVQKELGEDPTASLSASSDILSRFQGLQEAVEQGNPWQQFTAIVFLRLTPVVPFSASNYLLGLTPVQLAPFAAGTLSGMAAWCSVYGTLGGAGRSVLKKGTSLDALLSDLISQAELYAEEAGLALGVLAVLAGSIWWLRRQTNGGSSADQPK